MDSDLLNDVYVFIPEKFFLKRGEPRFDVYRALTRRIEFENSVYYVTKYGNSVFDIPAIIQIRDSYIVLSWRHDGKKYREKGPVEIREIRTISGCSLGRGILDKNISHIRWEFDDYQPLKYKNLVIPEKYCDKIHGDALVYTGGWTN